MFSHKFSLFCFVFHWCRIVLEPSSSPTSYRCSAVSYNNKEGSKLQFSVWKHSAGSSFFRRSELCTSSCSCRARSCQEVEPFLQWIEMWLLPRLPCVRMPVGGSIEVFLADFVSSYARLRGENNVSPLGEDDFRLLVGVKYPLNPPAPLLPDPIALALSKQLERTGNPGNPMAFSRIEYVWTRFVVGFQFSCL